MKTIDDIRHGNLLILIKKFKSQRALAEKVGIAPSQISQWVNRSPDSDSGKPRAMSETTARKIEASIEDLPHGWMDADHGDAPPASEKSNVGARPRGIIVSPSNGVLDPRTYRETSRLTLHGGCGGGVANYEIEEKGQKQAFRLNWLREMGADPDQVATVTAEGDSMQPRIMNGDSVVIEMREKGDTSFRSGKVYLITYQDEWYIKRLFKNPENNGVRISSDNPNKSLYPDWNLTQESLNNLAIVARVIGLAGRID